MTGTANASLSNIAQRLITAAVALPIVIAAVLLGGIPFTMLILAVAIVGVLEFYLLAQNRPSQGSALIGVPTLIALELAFYVGEPLLLVGVLAVSAAVTFGLEMLRHRTDFQRSLFQVGMTLAGVLYLGLPSGFLISLRAQRHGVLWILLILCVTWGTDSLAYIGGRLWGKTPLAPRLSPNKTREGAVVGVIGGILPSLAILLYAGQVSLAALIVIGIGPLVAILGDLLESALKRFFQVKDSHIAGLNLLPGHGGILDRIDALLLVTIFAYVILALFGVR